MEQWMTPGTINPADLGSSGMHLALHPEPHRHRFLSSCLLAAPVDLGSSYTAIAPSPHHAANMFLLPKLRWLHQTQTHKAKADRVESNEAAHRSCKAMHRGRMPTFRV